MTPPGIEPRSSGLYMKDMNPIIFPPAMGKQEGKLGSSALVRKLVQEKENSEFKPVKRRLKIDLVSHPRKKKEVPVV